MYVVEDNILIYGAAIWHYTGELLLECHIPDKRDELWESCVFRLQHLPIKVTLTHTPKDFGKFLFDTILKHGVRHKWPAGYFVEYSKD